MRTWMVLSAAVFVCGCAGGKHSAQEHEQLEESIRAIRAEVENLQREVGDLRNQTRPTPARVAGEGTHLGVPGGDAASLQVRWSSVHAGARLEGRLVPRGNGERVSADVQVTRGAP